MLHVCPATDTGFTPWSVQQGIFSPVSALSADALTSVHIQTQKGSNECLFILTRTRSMQIFGEIPFIKPQKYLLKCSYSPSVQWRALTSVHLLNIPSIGSHTIH